MQPKYKRILLKLSGESLAGENKHGIDFDVVQKICEPIKKCVEEIRETPLVVQCDEKFTEKRLSIMNMIKNVQCERILGFNASWKF